MKLLDSTGKSYGAKVGSDNRVAVESVQKTEQLNAALSGESYQIGSGPISLTSAGESAVIFFKNLEDRDIIISAINISSTAMTGSSATVFLAKAYLGGTALSAGTAVVPLNNNFGSSKILLGTTEAGGEAQTVTNGTASGAFYIPASTFFHSETAWVIPKGVSVALSITPGASNTAMVATVTLEGHLASDS